MHTQGALIAGTTDAPCSVDPKSQSTEDEVSALHSTSSGAGLQAEGPVACWHDDECIAAAAIPTSMLLFLLQLLPLQVTFILDSLGDVLGLKVRQA